jgi:hypothetical protein
MNDARQMFDSAEHSISPTQPMQESKGQIFGLSWVYEIIVFLTGSRRRDLFSWQSIFYAT